MTHALKARPASWLALTSLVLLLGSGCPPKVESVYPATAGFWGPEDFQGGFDPSREEILNTATTYKGDIVFLNLATGVADDVLPADLQLAPRAGTDMPGQHPAVLLFGAQTNLRWTIPPMHAGDPYNELILLIPFVQKTPGTRWHNYVVRMYLDWPMGIEGGNFFYGYRKEMATLSHIPSVSPPPEFVFKVDKAGPAFVAQVTGVTAWMSDSAARTGVTNYQAMKTIFELPVLGTWTMNPTSSQYICSYFVFDWSGASVRGASSRIQFLANFVPNMTQWVALSPMGSLTSGHFGVIDLKWQITLPKTCDF